MITGDFRSAVHSAAQETWRMGAVVQQIRAATDDAAPVMLQYAREALRSAAHDWEVLSQDGAPHRELWHELEHAATLATHDHDYISRVVWLLWEYRRATDEWAALRGSALHILADTHSHTVSLSDIIIWMTSEGEQHIAAAEPPSRSPSAWFRGGWAWCVLHRPKVSPFLYDQWFQAWATTSPTDDEPWMIDPDPTDSTSANLDGGDNETWVHELYTTPIEGLS